MGAYRRTRHRTMDAKLLCMNEASQPSLSSRVAIPSSAGSAAGNICIMGSVSAAAIKEDRRALASTRCSLHMTESTFSSRTGKLCGYQILVGLQRQRKASVTESLISCYL